MRIWAWEFKPRISEWDFENKDSEIDEKFCQKIETTAMEKKKREETFQNITWTESSRKTKDFDASLCVFTM